MTALSLQLCPSNETLLFFHTECSATHCIYSLMTKYQNFFFLFTKLPALLVTWFRKKKFWY